MGTAFRLFLFRAVALVSSSQALADEVSSCSAPEGVNLRAFPDEIPAGIMKFLDGPRWDLARPGEPFNSTDIAVPGRKWRRVMFAWESGRRWIIATERGGRGYNNPVLVFDQVADSGDFRFSRHEIVLGPDKACAAAVSWINSPN